MFLILPVLMLFVIAIGCVQGSPLDPVTDPAANANATAANVTTVNTTATIGDDTCPVLIQPREPDGPCVNLLIWTKLSKFLSAVPGGDVLTLSDGNQPQDKFRLELYNGGIAIRTIHNTFICAKGDFLAHCPNTTVTLFDMTPAGGNPLDGFFFSDFQNRYVNFFPNGTAYLANSAQANSAVSTYCTF